MKRLILLIQFIAICLAALVGAVGLARALLILFVVEGVAGLLWLSFSPVPLERGAMEEEAQGGLVYVPQPLAPLSGPGRPFAPPVPRPPLGRAHVSIMAAMAPRQLAVHSSSTPLPGSLADVAARHGIQVEQAFMGSAVVVVFDSSISMVQRLRSGLTRYETALLELAALQRDRPGEIAVVSFADAPYFRPSGIPQQPDGRTNLALALEFVRPADQFDMQFVVITDGEPDSERDALREARRFRHRLNTVFIGDDAEGEAAHFLAHLARESGGKGVVSIDAVNMSTAIQLAVS